MTLALMATIVPTVVLDLSPQYALTIALHLPLATPLRRTMRATMAGQVLSTRLARMAMTAPTVVLDLLSYVLMFAFQLCLGTT